MNIKEKKGDMILFRRKNIFYYKTFQHEINLYERNGKIPSNIELRTHQCTLDYNYLYELIFTIVEVYYS